MVMVETRLSTVVSLPSTPGPRNGALARRSVRGRLAIPIRRESPGEDSGCPRGIDTLDEHALVSVRQKGLTAARRVDETRRRLLKRQRVIHAREVNAVLEAAAHHRLLVVRRIGRTPFPEPSIAGVRPRVLRVKYDVRAARRGPANRLRVAPPLVADHDAELDTVHFEQLPRVAGHVEPIFARIELVLGLSAECVAGPAEHDRFDLPTGVDDAFHAQDDRRAVRTRHPGYRDRHAVLIGAVERRNLEVLSP